MTAAAHRVGLKGCSGHKVILRAVAERLGQPVPASRLERSRWLRAFNASTPPAPRRSAATKQHRDTQPFAVSDAFLESYEWRRLRMEVIKEYGARCQCCGAGRKDGVVINVDHIKPRRRFPELALERSNLQVLCGPCNHGKGNWDETDWRDAPAAPTVPAPLPVEAPRLVKAARKFKSRDIVAEAADLDEQFRRRLA